MCKKLMFAVLLLCSMTVFATPTPLLKVNFFSEPGPLDISNYSSSCTIYNNGDIIIYRHHDFVQGPPQLLLSENTSPLFGLDVEGKRSLKFKASSIKQMIALASKGTMQGNVGINPTGLKYIAYQGANEVLLRKGDGKNNSEWADILMTVIDEWCGDISTLK